MQSPRGEGLPGVFQEQKGGCGGGSGEKEGELSGGSIRRGDEEPERAFCVIVVRTLTFIVRIAIGGF